jgi:ribosomal protein S18 acetylase RimI-like enzyme
MTSADIEPAAEMIRRGDWGERQDWFEFAVRAGHCDALVATAGDEVIGTGVGTRHGRVGWVGTIYVSTEHRRQGIGQALSAAVCERLEAAGCRSLVLVATELGRPVYERLGFAEAAWYRVLEQDGLDPASAGPVGPLVRPFARDDLPAAAGLDRAATGEDRRATLEAAVGVPGGFVAVAPGAPDEVRGFVLRPPWHGAATIAPDIDDALRLIRARRLAAGRGRRVRIGVVEPNDAGVARLADEGWTEIRRSLRMHRGELLAWRPDAIWGQFNFALG